MTPTVLIVEDEASIRKLAKVNLAARGYGVKDVESAEEGLEQLRAQPVGLLLLDIKLPGMQGWELLETLASEPEIASDVPVIVMTASAADAYRNMRSYPNVVKVLAKPFTTEELVQSVADALKKRGDAK